MKKKIVFIITCFVFFGQFLSAQELNPEDFKNASVSIKYYDRTIYYPENSKTNPIQIHVSIKNKGTDTLRFKLADDRMFSIDFNAYTVKNSKLPATESLIRKRTTNQTVYFREIAIEPGEEYSFIENLKDFIDIKNPSVYYIELKFYPELYKMKAISLVSNRLTLEIKPSPQASSSSIIPVQTKTAQILVAQDISPDEVVEQTIVARQKSLWDQYFLYMDVEAMLQRNPAAKRKYTTASAEERNRMIKNYKAELQLSRIDNDIVAIPQDFEIEKTTYTKTEGTVTVTQWFKYPTYREKKSYVYKVRKRDGHWQIYDWAVTNLGTE